MKYLNIILLFWFCYSGKAQQVKFELYRSNPCKNTEVLDSAGYYIMALDGKMYNPSGINGGTTLLPEKGEYFVYVTFNLSYDVRPEYSVQKVSINDSGIFIFRYTECRLNNWNVGEGVWNMYYMCKDLANGYQQDFYPNGKIRIRGNFKNGKPKDSLVFFYPNGNLQRRVYYHKYYTLVEEYDTSARLVKISHNRTNGFFMTDYKSTQYFSNGRIRRRESNFNGIVRIEDYYLNGILKFKKTKRVRYEYYENGKINTAYHWKGKRDQTDSKNWLTFLVYKKEYDQNSQLLELDVYEFWGNIRHQPRIDIYNSDWIDIVRKYKNGKEISTVRDVDPKKYFAESNNP